MYNNVKFIRTIDNIEKNSFADWNLLLAPYTLNLPGVQTNYVNIAGRDGELDLSESLGQINYNNRELDLVFTSIEKINGVTVKHSSISNFLHGKRLKITLPNDTDFYYVGRCEIGSLDRAKRTNQISMRLKLEPFKYKNEVTEIQFEIGVLPYTKIINNLKMPTIPTIITTNNVIMNFENTDYSWSEGEHLNTAIVLKEGENIFTFKNRSSGNVTFQYQEGAL